MPVFIVSKEFVRGKNIKSGIGNPISGLRPYSVFGSNGVIQQTKVNYTEIGHYANISKDIAKMALDRVVRQLSDKAKMVKKIKNIFSIFNNISHFRMKQLRWKSLLWELSWFGMVFAGLFSMSFL